MAGQGSQTNYGFITTKDMENRPNRRITKPIRNKTTSSSEERPKKRKVQLYAENYQEDDFFQLQEVLEEEDEEEDNYNNEKIQYNLEDIAETTPHRYSSVSEQCRSTEVPHHRSFQTEAATTSRHNYRTTLEKIEQQIAKFEDEVRQDLKKLHCSLQEILQYVKPKATVVSKPTCLPIASLAELEQFNNTTEEVYEEIVAYFHYIGGYNVEEQINVTLKEAFQDDALQSVTWYGTRTRVALCNNLIIRAIYEGQCRNNKIEKPDHAQFEAAMKIALRTAQERVRHRRTPCDSMGRRTSYWTNTDYLVEEKME